MSATPARYSASMTITVIGRNLDQGIDLVVEAEPGFPQRVRAAGVTPDDRIADAIALVRTKQLPDGTWPLDIRYPGKMPIDLDETPGQPSRWITLHALRILRWSANAFPE